MFEKQVALFVQENSRYLYGYFFKDEGNQDRVTFLNGKDQHYELLIPHTSLNPVGEHLQPLLRKIADDADRISHG